MAPDSGYRIKELFSEASELEPGRRSAFLDSACAGDEEIRQEVERLLETLDTNDGILESSVGQLLFSAPPETTTFAPGTVLGESFRVDRLIGTGGMGEVYAAEDLRLGGQLAIKTLRSRYLSLPDFAARFRREIQLARKVTHPNICRIFDIGRERDLVYLTMELLDGETLSARLKRGALAPEEARPILMQIAAGLSALHNMHVIHRDLKPSNVILVGQGQAQRAVITDFGLAHELPLDGADESQTFAGQIVGTPAYAAPEQLTGKKVGPQADIYSLGLVMYEMLCGRKPFEGDTGFESAAQKLTKTADPPSAYAQLDPRWDTLVLSCLERDPRNRIRTANEVLELLVALGEEPVPSQALQAAVLANGGRTRRPGRFPRYAAICSVAAALATVLPIQFSPLGSPIRRKLCAQMPGSTLFCDLPAAKDIAVFPFQVEAENDAKRALGTGWARHVRETFHRLAPEPEKLCVHLRNDHLSEGVRLVLEGGIRASGNSVSLNLLIRESLPTDANTPPLVLRKITRTWRLDSASDVYAGPLMELAQALDLKYPAGDWQAWTQTTPKHAASVAQYLEGLGYLELRKYEEAATAFNAVIDPNSDFGFAAAHVGLGDAYRLMWNRDRDPRWELRARRSYERALPLDRDAGFAGAEKSLAELDVAQGKTEAAIEHYKTALNFWPFDHPLQRRLVAAYESSDKFADAEAILRAAAQRAPRCWQPHNTLASLYSRHGRLRDAEKSFLEVIRLAPDNGTAYHNLAVDYIKMGRYDDAIRMASRSLDVRAYPMSYATLGRAFWNRGCIEDGVINIRKAVELYPDFYIFWGYLADILYATAPSSAEAAQAAARVIELCRRVLDRTPADVLPRVWMALNLARIGENNSAVVNLRLALAQSPANQHIVPSAAEALEIAGKRSEALSVIESALRRNLPLHEIEANPRLAELRRDPKYRELLIALHLNPMADPGGLTPQQATACPQWGIPGKGLRLN